MSVSKETYMVFGFKFDGDFTEEYWDEDFRDETEYWDEKDSGKIKFLTDGMNGDYTFFGQIIELGKRGDWYEDEIKEFDLTQIVSSNEILKKFKEFYPKSELKTEDVKLYYVPHYV